MDLQTYFHNCKQEIQKLLDVELKWVRGDLHQVNVWGADAIDRLAAFVSQGKMLRGGLVWLAADMYGRPADDAVRQIAAAMELFQAGLLIHDDIMDVDRVRRGQPTMWVQYQSAIDQSAIVPDSINVGGSMAMCVGDAAFFMAMKLVAQSGAMSIGPLIGQELIRVCVAQMADVAWAEDQHQLPSEAEILNMYLHKTAGYSIVLPLTAGALVAGQTGPQLDLLKELGTYLGLLFQLKDDELGVWGDPDTTGKPVGADISEGKKTLYFCWLVHRSHQKDRDRIGRLFGCRQSIAPEDLNWVRQQLERLEIKTDMTAKINALANQAAEVLAKLEIADDHRKLLTEFIAYCQRRQA